MADRNNQESQWLLLVAVFIIATCGLIYELVAGTLASYLLGDSVMQFSTIIGVYLFSMGIGSFLSKYFQTGLLQWFVKIELLVGLVGGLSSCILFLVFPLAASFRLILYAIVCLTGMFVGLEIPLLMRILKDRIEFKEMVSRVFTFDYIGALLASLIFPLVLVPHLGLMRTSLFFGILNIGVGWYLAFYFKKEIRNAAGLQLAAVLLLLAELAAFVFSDKLMHYSETLTYNDDVVYATSSPYQRIVLTKNQREMRLFLNGNLQFSSADEYRYHEALVHPVMAGIQQPKEVLVLGGGDGLAVRELLKYSSVQHITLVDLDAVMTGLFKHQEILTGINQSSLQNNKVNVINSDAFSWLISNHKTYDAIIIDFPDPSNFSIGKLYTTTFYKLISKSLDANGIAVVQSTSPLVAPKSFWCVNATLKATGFYTIPYHNYVPSFGEWGYILAMHKPAYSWLSDLPKGLKFLNRETMQQMLSFPDDMKAHQPIAINKLNNQVLVTYFEDEWKLYQDQ